MRRVPQKNKIGKKRKQLALVSQTIPRLFIVPRGSFCPDRVRCTLMYDLMYTAPNTTIVFPFSVETINCSNPNQITTVSTLLPGYAAWALFYRKYITLEFLLRFTVCNNENFPIEIFAAGDNSQPTALLNPTPFFSQGRKNSKTMLLSPKGGMDRGTLLLQLAQNAFGGDAPLPVSCYLEGTTDNSSPPANNIYIYYGYRNTGLATVTPPTFRIRAEITLEFYEQQSPAS